MPGPKPRAAAPLESEVTAAVLAAAALYGISLSRRNVGMAVGASGKPVRFGTPGEPDWSGTVAAGPNRGRTISCEIKHGSFDPAKLRGGKADHFALQIAALRSVNAAGGLALWLRDGLDAAEFFRKVAAVPNLRVELDEQGYCYTTDELEDLP